MQLYNELDENGNVVRTGFTLSPYYTIPTGHSIVEYVAPTLTLKELIDNQIGLLQQGYQTAIGLPVTFTNQAGVTSTYPTTSMAINGQTAIQNLQECVSAGAPAWMLGVWADTNGVMQRFTYQDLLELAQAMAAIEMPDWKNLAIKIAELQTITDPNPLNPSPETVQAIQAITF